MDINSEIIEKNKQLLKKIESLEKEMLEKEYATSDTERKGGTFTLKEDLKIACILDEFSYECFKYECTLIQLDTAHWMDTLKQNRPDFLLVESAWKGSGGAWTNRIENLHLKNDNSLKKLVEWCKNNKIPTVFWNKEDPIHYDIFIKAASLFDYVFTTDSGSVDIYKKRLGHSRVYTLLFAAQPKIHNPIGRNKERLGSVAFAGSWYNNHPDRIKSMEKILQPAFKYGLHIYDRNVNCPGNLFKFPEIYRPYVKGSIPYGQISDIYKKYRVFLNVNIVTDSPTMFSRRVFELLACGTPVISGPSIGIENLFKDIVKIPRDEKDMSNYLDMLIYDVELNNRMSVLGQREVFNKHTCRHRLDEIAGRLGLNRKKNQDAGVSIVTVANGNDTISRVFENYRSQVYGNKGLMVFINNDSVNIDAWNREASKYDNVRVFRTDKVKTLEECLRFAADKGTFDYLSIFDENSCYGPNFISDLLNSFEYADADIVGKHSCFTYFECTNKLYLYRPDMEYRYVPYLNGAAIIVKKGIINKIKFVKETGSGDTVISSDGSGLKLYSSDKYNYAYMAKHSNSPHVSNIQGETLLKNCRLAATVPDYKTYVFV